MNPASWLPLAAGHKFTQPRSHHIVQLLNCYLSVKAVGLAEVLRVDHPEHDALLPAGLDANPHLLQVDPVAPVGVEDLEVGMGLAGNELATKVEGRDSLNLPATP